MDEFRKAAKAESSSFYLQIVGIIQSLSLGFLLIMVREFHEQFWPLMTLGAVTSWLQAALIFQFIVMTWHVNIGNAIVMSRLVGLPDSYIPFIFSIPQFFLAVCLPPAHFPFWCYSIGLFSAATFWAYTDMYIKDKREEENESYFGELDKFRVFGLKYRNFVLIYVASGGLIFIGIGILFQLMGSNAHLSLLCVAFANFLVIFFTYWHVSMWRFITARTQTQIPNF